MTGKTSFKSHGKVPESIQCDSFLSVQRAACSERRLCQICYHQLLLSMPRPALTTAFAAFYKPTNPT